MAGREGIEEQTLPRYHERHYYPVKIGEVFEDQYRVIAKLGYGAYATVWLAWDQRSKQYTSLNVCVSQDSESSPVLNEINMQRRLNKITDMDQRNLPGVGLTRLADDIFEIDGASLLKPTLLHRLKAPGSESSCATGDVSKGHTAQASS